MAKRSYPLAKVYGLLEPGPVVLVTTARKGRANIMTMSWHAMMEFEPPLIGCVISGRNASFDTLRATKECVINVPTRELAKQVVGIGNCSGLTVDKFARFGLTPVEASQVQAPLIAECYASLECRVADTRLVPLQLLHYRGGAGAGRHRGQKPADPAPSRQRRVRGGRRDGQAALPDEIGSAGVFLRDDRLSGWILRASW